MADHGNEVEKDLEGYLKGRGNEKHHGRSTEVSAYLSAACGREAARGFSAGEAQSYSVEAVPAKEIVRSYVDGSTVRQFLFVVASREFFGDKIRQQLDNLSFYGDFSEWLREQTMAGKLPILARAGRSC